MQIIFKSYASQNRVFQQNSLSGMNKLHYIRHNNIGRDDTGNRSFAPDICAWYIRIAGGRWEQILLCRAKRWRTHVQAETIPTPILTVILTNTKCELNFYPTIATNSD